MKDHLEIVDVVARQILDSRCFPTVEVEIYLEDGRILKGINTNPSDSTNEDKWQLYETAGTPAFYKDFPIVPLISHKKNVL